MLSILSNTHAILDQRSCPSTLLQILAMLTYFCTPVHNIHIPKKHRVVLSLSDETWERKIFIICMQTLAQADPPRGNSCLWSPHDFRSSSGNQFQNLSYKTGFNNRLNWRHHLSRVVSTTIPCTNNLLYHCDHPLSLQRIHSLHLSIFPFWPLKPLP